jgi:membrane-associated phospholipid phosphatase
LFQTRDNRVPYSCKKRARCSSSPRHDGDTEFEAGSPVLVTLRKGWLIGLLVLATAVYVGLWIGWTMHWGWLDAFDSWALDACYRFGVDRRGWVTFWNVLCTVLGPNAFRIVGLVVIVVALRRRQLRLALFLVLSVELNGLIIETLKVAAGRPRPTTALVFAPASAFPSGHALGVMASVLALTVIVLPLVRRALWGWVIAGGVMIVLLVGGGRVVLNVHHPSDVLAGWAAGYMWFAASLLVLAAKPVTAEDETPVVPGSAH